MISITQRKDNKIALVVLFPWGQEYHIARSLSVDICVYVHMHTSAYESLPPSGL